MGFSPKNAFETENKYCKIGQHSRCSASGCEWQKVFSVCCTKKHNELNPYSVRKSSITYLAQTTEGQAHLNAKKAEGTTKPLFDERYYLQADKRHGENIGKKIKFQAPKKLRHLVYERDGYRCLKCGTPNKLTLDEVVPRSKGGKRSFENCQTLCEDCNLEKGTKTIDYRLNHKKEFTDNIKIATQDEWIQKIKVI